MIPDNVNDDIQHEAQLLSFKIFFIIARVCSPVNPYDLHFFPNPPVNGSPGDGGVANTRKL